MVDRPGEHAGRYGPHGVDERRQRVSGVDDVHVGGDVGVVRVLHAERRNRDRGDIGTVGEEPARTVRELVEPDDLPQIVEAVPDRRRQGHLVGGRRVDGDELLRHRQAGDADHRRPGERHEELAERLATVDLLDRRQRGQIEVTGQPTLSADAVEDAALNCAGGLVRTHDLVLEPLGQRLTFRAGLLTAKGVEDALAAGERDRLTVEDVVADDDHRHVLLVPCDRDRHAEPRGGRVDDENRLADDVGAAHPAACQFGSASARRRSPLRRLTRMVTVWYSLSGISSTGLDWWRPPSPPRGRHRRVEVEPVRSVGVLDPHVLRQLPRRESP